MGWSRLIPGIVYFYPAQKKLDGHTDRQKSELGKGPQNKISLKNQNSQFKKNIYKTFFLISFAQKTTVFRTSNLAVLKNKRLGKSRQSFGLKAYSQEKMEV